MLFSFGIFMLLGFIAAFLAFRSEYRRKETEGLIHPFPRIARHIHPLAWTLLGFAAGAKLVYWWLHRSMYIGTPQDFIFSIRGNLVGGLVAGLAAWLIAKSNASPPPTKEMTHPYELMDPILLYCSLFGFAGAILFAKFESPDSFGQISLRWLFTYNGMSFYGAFIAGALAFLYINHRYGIRPAIAADIGSPGMMLAYAIGRMGCHISGDGDWGIVNENPRPSWLQWLPDWAWAWRYPHNSIHQGIYIPGCSGSNCTVLTAPVYPTPLYESVICLCLFFLLWSLRRKIKRPGLLFAIFAILNGAERFTIEFIRVNPRYSIGAWHPSQAQLLALGWVFTGLTAVFISIRKYDISSKKLLLLCLSLVTAGSQVFANQNQTHWRWGKDNGPEKQAAWLAPQGFPVTLPLTAGISLRLHVKLDSRQGNDGKGKVMLQYKRGSKGPWTSISHTSAGHDFILIDATSTNTEWRIKPTAAVLVDTIYHFRWLLPGVTRPGGHGNAGPYMMFRSNLPIPGNAGIYRDSLVTGFFNRDSGWIASDGAYSIPLSDGRDLWVMGDSYIDHYDPKTGTIPCLFQVRNAALVQPLNNWNWKATATRIGNGPGIRSFFKNNTDDNHLLWPAGGYQQGDTVYVYCASIVNANGGLGFALGGSDFMAKMIMPDLTIKGFDPLQSFDSIAFGLSFDTEEQDGYIYTWGAKSAYITSNVFVARYPKDNPRAHWSFWNGAAWDTSLAHIARIATGASNSIYVTKVRNKYVLLSTEFSVSCDAGTHIYVATSDHITGPFTDRKVLYTIPDNMMGHTPFFYAPAIHPEYINEKNELLITYDINTYNSCEPACIDNGFNPDYYRPRGIRVPLSLIDPALK